MRLRWCHHHGLKISHWFRPSCFFMRVVFAFSCRRWIIELLDGMPFPDSAIVCSGPLEMSYMHLKRERQVGSEECAKKLIVVGSDWSANAGRSAGWQGVCKGGGSKAWVQQTANPGCRGSSCGQIMAAPITRALRGMREVRYVHGLCFARSNVCRVRRSGEVCPARCTRMLS